MLSSSSRASLGPECLFRRLLLHILDKGRVRLGKVLAVVVLLLLLALGLLGSSSLLSVALLHDHDDAGGTLRLGRGAELRARRDEDEGHVVVFAEDGQVRDDVLRGDVAGDDDDAGEGGVVGRGRGGLAEGLDDLLDAALEGVVLGSCSIASCVSLLRLLTTSSNGTGMENWRSCAIV